jgi:hypothetical protein
MSADILTIFGRSWVTPEPNHGSPLNVRRIARGKTLAQIALAVDSFENILGG